MTAIVSNCSVWYTYKTIFKIIDHWVLLKNEYVDTNAMIVTEEKHFLHDIKQGD